jgi:hypothetical protein
VHFRPPSLAVDACEPLTREQRNQKCVDVRLGVVVDVGTKVMVAVVMAWEQEEEREDARKK